MKTNSLNRLYRAFGSLLLAATFAAVPLQAEIVKAMVTWESIMCNKDYCQGRLHQLFSQIGSVADVNFNGQSGKATLYWKPNFKFDLNAINYSMHGLGLASGVDNISVKVRGVIIHDSSSVTIQSIGDNTRFMLLSPTKPTRNRVNEEYNVMSHVLDPQVRQQLIDAESNFQLVTVEGPLFDIERSPLKIIISNVSVQARD